MEQSLLGLLRKETLFNYTQKRMEYRIERKEGMFLEAVVCIRITHGLDFQVLNKKRP